MKRIAPALAMLALLLLGVSPAFSQDAGDEGDTLNHEAQALYLEGDGVQARLPERISNNAVALAVLDGRPVIYSFLGLCPGKTFRDTKLSAFEYHLVGKKGRVLPPVPGLHGRLAGVAAAVGGEIYIFGGYRVAADGTEFSEPQVHAYNPQSAVYGERSPIPTPVDDSVALVYKDRYVYLVSGWHDKGNVSLVQVYDTEKDHWFGATDYPGSPVFGHAGGMVENRLVIADGVRIVPPKNGDGKRKFEMTNEVYLGQIDPTDPAVISWKKLPPHPGKPGYRMAATGAFRENPLVVFAGGSDNPYNFNGIGYNGQPSEPSKRVFAYDLKQCRWRTFAPKETATMDHRGLLEFNGVFYKAGGMLSGQEVCDGIFPFRLRPQEKINPLQP